MTPKRLYSLVLALTLVASVVNTSAWPYDFETHRAINDGAVIRSLLNDYLIQELDLPQGTATTFNNRDVREWIREGGVLEDVPPQRTGNHFHYPLREWDRALLTDPPGSGFVVQSSVLWAQNPDQRPFLAPAETWSWIRARRELRDALTLLNLDDRNTAFANTFRAIGQVLHLIADASVPAHTRNDSHIGLLGLTGEPFEIWVEGEARRRPGEIDDEQARARFLAEFVPISEHFSPSILGTAPNPLAPIPIAKVFDADAYDGTAATLEVTGGLAVGITEVANANFFSYSTVFADRFDVTHPRFSPFPASTAVEQFIDPTNNRRYWRKTSRGATVEHLATVSRLDFFRQLLVGGPPRTGGLDPVVHDEYARHLIPRAVGYSAALLDYFFRGTLDFTVSASSTSPNQNELTMTNTSAETMDGTFTLYADNAAGERDLVFPFDLTLEPGATSGPLSFSFPIALEQTFFLVFEGQLGNEKGAVVGKIKKTKKARLVLVTTGPIANAEWIISGIAPITITMKYKSVDHMDIRTTALDILGRVNVVSSSPDAAGRGRVMLTGTVPDFTDVTVSLKPPIPPQSAQTSVIMGVALNNGFLCISQISKGGLRAGLFPNKFSRGFKFAPCPE